MGFLSDIRSANSDRDGHGRSERTVFLASHSEKAELALVLAGATIGSGTGFAFGGTAVAASVLALPGWPFAAIGLLVGLS
jgi:hypothetical protein